MNTNLSAKEAKVLRDILFNESLRASDWMNNVDPGEQFDEAKAHYDLIDSMVTKVCRGVAKSK